MDEEPATEESAPAETAAAPVESAPDETESHAAGSATSINLGSASESKVSGEGGDEGVINLDNNTEDFPKENVAFDGPEGEGGEKPEVAHRPSHDETDQIEAAPVHSGEDINLDTVRKSIIDPDLVQPENIFGQPRSPLGPVVSISSSSEEDEEEEEELESDIRSYLAEFGLQPEKKIPINREQYEEDYRNLREVALRLRRKNGLLHKKISEYYRKRKLNRVFEETSVDIYETLVDKYEERITEYHELQAKTSREREAVDNEMNDMMNLRDEQLAELENSFADMQTREQEIGHGLMDTSTGKAITDKVVERLLQRQKIKSEEIAKIRLSFIKRRDHVKQIDNKIKALETIGGTLHLMDFEQLRMENQTFSDKIEERDEELMRLRDRYGHAMQALAHIREKINIIEVQIDVLREKRCTEEANVAKSRENLNKLKIQRDTNRSQRDKLKLKSGILTYSKLLLDMEGGMKAKEALKVKLKELQERHHKSKENIFHLRNLIDKTEQIQTKHPQRKMKSRRRTTATVSRYLANRATITYPVLPRIANLKARLDRMQFYEK